MIEINEKLFINIFVKKDISYSLINNNIFIIFEDLNSYNDNKKKSFYN